MNRQHESGDEGSTARSGRARAVLQESAEGLSGHARSRLRLARGAALAAAAEPQGLLAALARTLAGWLGERRWPQLLPAGAALASLLVVAVVLRMPAAPLHAVASGGDELELLADTDALAMAQEPEVDYDFYEWAVAADTQDVPAAAVGT